MEKKKYRSAKTGKFVSKKFATDNKETTVGETITKPKKKIMPKKKVEVVEEVCKKSSLWKEVADFIHFGGIVVLSSFAIGFMLVMGKYFALVALGLI